MGWQKANRTRVEDHVRLRGNFSITHARGERRPDLPIDRGRLDEVEAGYLAEDSALINYVVFSYATPIAWMLEDGTPYVTAQSFSPTTGTLQVLVCAEWECERGKRY